MLGRAAESEVIEAAEVVFLSRGVDPESIRLDSERQTKSKTKVASLVKSAFVFCDGIVDGMQKRLKERAVIYR